MRSDPLSSSLHAGVIRLRVYLHGIRCLCDAEDGLHL